MRWGLVSHLLLLNLDWSNLLPVNPLDVIVLCASEPRCLGDPVVGRLQLPGLIVLDCGTLELQKGEEK